MYLAYGPYNHRHISDCSSVGTSPFTMIPLFHCLLIAPPDISMLQSRTFPIAHNMFYNAPSATVSNRLRATGAPSASVGRCLGGRGRGRTACYHNTLVSYLKAYKDALLGLVALGRVLGGARRE